MNSVIETLVTDEIAKAGKSNKQYKPKKLIVRENFLLFNMLLEYLERNHTLEGFVNRFDSCKQTDSIYKKEAQKLYKLGIRSIKKYSSQVIKQICKRIDDIPLPFQPYSDHYICDEVDLIRLLMKIEDIKNHLSKLHFEADRKISFSKNVLDIDDIICQVSSILFIFKLTRLDNDSLYDFLIRNLDREFVSHFLDAVNWSTMDYFTKKEGKLNRKFIIDIRACVIAIIKIQLRNHRLETYELGCLDLGSFICVDRVVSHVIEI